MLTALIPCKNERAHIAACIDSVRSIANEILVADSGSTDGTKEIARGRGCRVIEREYRTSGDFKNWAIPQAAHDWVLVVDADERVTPELAEEIRDLLDAEPTCDGYWLRRTNYFLGQPIRFGDWGRDPILRLFRRDAGRYVGQTDHAEMHIPSGRVGRLRGRLLHHSFVSYSDCLAKSYRYAQVQAELWHAAGRRASYPHLLTRGPLRFFRSYVLRLGFLDGLAGLQCSILNGYGAYLKQACLWELAQRTAAPRRWKGANPPLVRRSGQRLGLLAASGWNILGCLALRRHGLTSAGPTAEPWADAIQPPPPSHVRSCPTTGQSLAGTATTAG